MTVNRIIAAEGFTTWACWAWQENGNPTSEFTTKEKAEERRALGKIPKDAELQFEFEAVGWENAIEEHNRRLGYSEYVPVRFSEPPGEVPGVASLEVWEPKDVEDRVKGAWDDWTEEDRATELKKLGDD